MVKKTSKPRRARKTGSAASTASKAGKAGKPTEGTGAVAANVAPPTDEELDMRDRMKTGPRRQAGPPLDGDNPEPMPAAQVAANSLPGPTDPAG